MGIGDQKGRMQEKSVGYMYHTIFNDDEFDLRTLTGIT
jgi:hypothetical protein